MNTLSVLQALINSIFTTNGTKDITGLETRTTLNTILDSTYMPAGATMSWYGSSTTVPSGWHLINGASLSITDYNDLFLSLGGYLSPYGVNVGAGTFQIPTIQKGYSEVQCGTGYVLGSVGGEETHILTVSEIPGHNHLNGVATNMTGNGVMVFGETTDGVTTGDHLSNLSVDTITINSGTPLSQGYTGLKGGGQAHNNMPPYICVNKIIKLY